MTCSSCIVYVTNSSDLSTDPWGTPMVSLVDDESSPLSCTWNAQFMRYVCSHLIVNLINPYLFQVGKAESRGRRCRMLQTDREHTGLWHVRSRRRLRRHRKLKKNAICGLWNWLYADWVLGISLVAFKCGTIRIWTTFSRIFDKCGRFDTGLKFFVSWISTFFLALYFIFLLIQFRRRIWSGSLTACFFRLEVSWWYYL